MIRSVRRGLYDTKRPTFERASVGYSPDGTVVPPHYPRFTPGSYALSFDNANYIRVPETVLPNRLDYFTFEAWIRSGTPLSEYRRVFNRGEMNRGGGAQQGAIEFLFYNRSCYIGARGDNGSTPSYYVELESDFNELEWHHFAFVGGKDIGLRLFVDGLLKHQTSITDLGPFEMTDVPYINIGRRRSSSSQQFFIGDMANIRWWSVARSEQEIHDNMKSVIYDADGILFSYPFIEKTPGIAKDVSGNGYDGTIHGATYTDHTPYPPYGKSILIEEGTENLMANTVPRMRSNNDAVTPVQDEPFEGHRRIRRITDGYERTQLTTYTTEFIDVLEGETHTFSIQIKPEVDVDVRLHNVGDYVLCRAGEWTTVTATITEVEDRQRRFPGLFSPDVVGLGNPWIEYKNAQVEAKPYPTSFTVGVRAPEQLLVPTLGVINPEEGQIDIDLNIPSVAMMSGNGYVFDAGLNPSNQFHFARRGSTGDWHMGMGGTSWTSLNVSQAEMGEGERRLTIKWAEAEIHLFLDGELKKSASSPAFMFGSLYLGSSRGSTSFLNTTFNGFRIRSRAMTDEQIADEFAQGPLRSDQLTTYFLPFNGNLDTSQMVKRSPRWRGYPGVTM